MPVRCTWSLLSANWASEECLCSCGWGHAGGPVCQSAGRGWAWRGQRSQTCVLPPCRWPGCSPAARRGGAPPAATEPARLTALSRDEIWEEKIANGWKIDIQNLIKWRLMCWRACLISSSIITNPLTNTFDHQSGGMTHLSFILRETLSDN